jgi:hypothetical protein
MFAFEFEVLKWSTGNLGEQTNSVENMHAALNKESSVIPLRMSRPGLVSGQNLGLIVTSDDGRCTLPVFWFL